jgi:hypothetical protein
VGTFDETLRVGETLDWVARADLRGVTTVPLERVVLHRRLHDSNTGVTRRDQRIDYVRALRASILRRRTAAADTTEHP